MTVAEIATIAFAVGVLAGVLGLFVAMLYYFERR